MHIRRNNKENKTYLQGLRLFGKTLPRNIKSILKKNSYNYSEIVNKWNKLVSKDVANHSYPKRRHEAAATAAGAAAAGAEAAGRDGG